MEQRHANRRWAFIVNVLAASNFLRGSLRERMYRLGGIDTNGTQIRSGCWFFSARVKFGADGMVNGGCQFENRELVTVGDRVYFGPQVFVGTSTHEIGSELQRAGNYRGREVTIGDGCWIGARAVILPGVDVAAGCIIAAGAVVTQSTTPNGLYAGVPAVRKRDLP